MWSLSHSHSKQEKWRFKATVKKVTNETRDYKMLHNTYKSNIKIFMD